MSRSLPSSAPFDSPVRLKTRLTDILETNLPIICGPMFLVSDVNLVVAACEAGILGSFPALNYRSTQELAGAIRQIHNCTSAPFAVNLIVNRSNVLLERQLDICVAERVPIYITSLGNPERVIEAAHESGARVICDVTNLKYALKAESLGADAVNAVVAGAGGHTGYISPMVLIPELRRELKIPIICAGGISDGEGMAAALTLGADGVQLGTRFIASAECAVTDAYKRAIIEAKTDDIMLTERVSGQPASVIRTPFTEKLGTRQTAVERFFTGNRYTKGVARAVLAARSFVLFGNAAHKTTRKTVWGAGQTSGLVDEVLPVAQIVNQIVAGYMESIERLPRVERPPAAVLH